MITEKSKNLIKEEMLSLPKEAQEAISASGWEKISEEIGKRYLLDEGEIETFQLETASFLLGLVDEDAYQKNIENEIGTSRDEAEKIAEEVNQKIFVPIINALEENIKKNLGNKNPSPEQTLDFILSGGNYSVFIAPTEEKSAPVVREERNTATPIFAPPVNKIPAVPVAPPSLADIKAKLQISDK